MNEIHEFDSVIYPRLLWIAVNPNNDTLKEFFGEDLELGKEQWKAQVFYPMIEKQSLRIGTLIVFNSKKFMEIETITHEALHVAIDVFSDLGINFDGKSQEALAYYTGWVAECCEQVKRNKYNERIHRTRS